VEPGGTVVNLERRKALALAAYLALAERPRPRDELAALLWPELNQERARAALRSTLPNLTSQLPRGALAADRRTLVLRHEALWVDVLAALEDKSLLRRGSQGRYSFHLLLQQYAAERLAAEPAEQAERCVRHARYYAGLAAKLADAMRGTGQPAALAVIAEEDANLRAAWAWVLGARDLAAMGLMLDCLACYNDLRGSRQAGDAALAEAEAVFSANPSTEAGAARLLGRVLAWRARLLLLNRAEAAEPLLERAVALAEGQADIATLGFCLASRGMSANMRGEQAR